MEASVDEGRISNPNKRLPDGNPILQIDDIQSTIGSAGSPMLVMKDGQPQVIGMLISQNPRSFSLAIPISTIWRAVRKSGADNQRSATDQYYSDGLNSLWQGNYREARAKFSYVKGLFPSHSEAERLISEIDQILADRYRYPWTNPNYQIIAGLVGGMAAVGLLAYLLLRS